ncbi:MAG TPA: DUF4870 domain-containing protein [Gammaproteobacteria bacterium]
MTQHDDIASPVTEADAPGAEQRQWAFFGHLSALTGIVIPFGNLLGPLIIWQIKKDAMPFVADQAKEALNFQITVCIAIFVCVVLSVVLIGLLLLPLVAIAAFVLTIVGAIKANNGEAYRYPFTLRLID